MTAIEITCRPRDGILTVSADTVAALDQLGQTVAVLEHENDWAIDVHLPDGITLTARPATTQPLEEAA